MQLVHLFGLLRNYFEAGFLISASFLFFTSATRIILRLKIPIHHSWLVKNGYLLLVSSLLLPWFLQTLPRARLLRPSVQVFSGALRNQSTEANLVFSPVQDHGMSAQVESGWQLSGTTLTAVFLGIAVFALMFLGSFLFRVYRFHRGLAKLPRIKKIGRVSILVSDEYSVAFSTWTPSQALVVIPTGLLGAPSDYRLTLAHELQHHRQRDTFWIFILASLKALFFWNPCIYGFSKLLTELQEFACDEFLIGRRKYSAQAYGGCLIRAAESSICSQSRLVGTASMAVAQNVSLLRRRIQMILKYTSNRPLRALPYALGVGFVCVLTSLAYAAKSSVQEQRVISMEDAKTYAQTLTSSQIPITVNELVLEKLNALVGTSEGRKWVREGRERMVNYQKMIHAKLSAKGLPLELLAIPLFESGFKNLPPTPPQKGAGIWEFIAETARRYQLEVSEDLDERLNPAKETDAAVSYLTDLHKEFGDWRLAIKAYNEGEARVRSLIETYQTRDPWVLERKSRGEGYLSGVMAMILILNHPELAE